MNQDRKNPTAPKRPETREELDQILVELAAVLASVTHNAAALCTELAADYNRIGATVDDVLLGEGLLERAELLGGLEDQCLKQWRALVEHRGVFAKRAAIVQMAMVLLIQPGQVSQASQDDDGAAQSGDDTGSAVPR